MLPRPFFTPQRQKSQRLFQHQAQQLQQLQLQQGRPFLQQQQQQQYQPQQMQVYLFTNDKAPAIYSTKWTDLHPDSQKILLLIEERLLEYRDESQRLDQCSRLNDSSISSDGFELDVSHMMQELVGISTAMERERALLQELMVVVKGTMRNTELAVHSCMMLHPRFFHPNVGAGSIVPAPAKAPGAVAAAAPNSTRQPMSSSIVAVVDFYSGLPRKPSPFLHDTVARFEKYLGECRQQIGELEQLLLSDADGNYSGSDLSVLQSLPKVMFNVHGFFVHVAAKVEGLHLHIESMKTAYLSDQRRRGDGNDPFLEADLRETAKQEAAARRVHPMMHLPVVTQPSKQVAGLFASSAMPGASSAPQPSAGTSPAKQEAAARRVHPMMHLPVVTQPSKQVAGLFASSAMPGASSAPQPSAGTSSASSRGGFSLSTPFSAPSATTSSSLLFSTPPASLFRSSGAVPQSSLFSASRSLFGSTPTHPLSSTGASKFGSTTVAGSSISATPSFASGSATASGASFETASKRSKSKARTTRR